MFKLCVASMSLTMRDEDVRSFDQYANYAKGALTLATERLVMVTKLKDQRSKIR